MASDPGTLAGVCARTIRRVARVLLGASESEDRGAWLTAQRIREAADLSNAATYGALRVLTARGLVRSEALKLKRPGRPHRVYAANRAALNAAGFYFPPL